MSVIMITGPGCGQCKAAKSFLKQRNVEVQEKDIRQSTWAQKKASELGLKTLPIILAGDAVVSGFQPTKLRELVEGLPKTPATTPAAIHPAA